MNIPFSPPDITDEEIADAKANLITAYKSFNDKQASIINLYMGQRFLGVVEDIDTMIAKITAITKEDVVEVANKLDEKQENVIMFVYDDKKIFEKSKAYTVQI